MIAMFEKQKGSRNYLKVLVLEEVKKEYQQYVELRKVCDLVDQKEKEEPLYLSPNPKNPLTTNRFRVRRIVK